MTATRHYRYATDDDNDDGENIMWRLAVLQVFPTSKGGPQRLGPLIAGSVGRQLCHWPQIITNSPHSRAGATSSFCVSMSVTFHCFTLGLRSLVRSTTGLFSGPTTLCNRRYSSNCCNGRLTIFRFNKVMGFHLQVFSLVNFTISVSISAEDEDGYMSAQLLSFIHIVQIDLSITQQGLAVFSLGGGRHCAMKFLNKKLMTVFSI